MGLLCNAGGKRARRCLMDTHVIATIPEKTKKKKVLQYVETFGFMQVWGLHIDGLNFMLSVCVCIYL